jgi:hypothetical protein
MRIGSGDKWLRGMLWLVIGLLVLTLFLLFGPPSLIAEEFARPFLLPVSVAVLGVTLAIAWREAGKRRR